jgi:hypothetical protein
LAPRMLAFVDPHSLPPSNALLEDLTGDTKPGKWHECLTTYLVSKFVSEMPGGGETSSCYEEAAVKRS